jgi:hypothetical protein
MAGLGEKIRGTGYGLLNPVTGIHLRYESAANWPPMSDLPTMRSLAVQPPSPVNPENPSLIVGSSLGPGSCTTRSSRDIEFAMKLRLASIFSRPLAPNICKGGYRHPVGNVN